MLGLSRTRPWPDTSACRTMTLMLPFSLIERHAVGAVRQGLALDTLLKSAMITRHHGDERDSVTPTQYLLFCLSTAIGIDDASHGLAKVGLGSLYPAIGLRMAFAYPNLGESLAALCRFYSSASSAMHYRLACTRNVATLSVAIDCWNDQDAAYNEELQLSWLFMNCLRFLGYPLPLLKVAVRDPRHFNLGRRHWAMGGPVGLGGVTEFSFPRAVLDAPPAAMEGPAIFWDCHKRWLDFMQEASPITSAASYVTEEGPARFSDMVRASGKSANTLRHRMQAADGSFREARRRALVEAATHRLRSSHEDVEAISADYGFSDGRSLRRFLKNATGMTVREIRQTAKDERTAEDILPLERLKGLTETMSI